MGVSDPDMAPFPLQRWVRGFVSPQLWQPQWQQQLCLSRPPQVFCRHFSSQHWAILQLPPSIRLSSMNKEVTRPIRLVGTGFCVRERALCSLPVPHPRAGICPSSHPQVLGARDSPPGWAQKLCCAQAPLPWKHRPSFLPSPHHDLHTSKHRNFGQKGFSPNLFHQEKNPTANLSGLL